MVGLIFIPDHFSYKRPKTNTRTQTQSYSLRSDTFARLPTITYYHHTLPPLNPALIQLQTIQPNLNLLPAPTTRVNNHIPHIESNTS